MPPEWKCSVCKRPAEYRTNKRCYCDEHWNFGFPVRSRKDIDINVPCSNISVGRHADEKA